MAVRFERDSAVAIITLERLEALNALECTGGVLRETEDRAEGQKALQRNSRRSIEAAKELYRYDLDVGRRVIADNNDELAPCLNRISSTD